MQSKAKTVAAYLKELPPDRRKAVAAVRNVILANIDSDIDEGMTYGMLRYFVPHRVFPGGYHCDPSSPVPYMSVASQVQYISVYMMFAYMTGGTGEQWIKAEYARHGRRVDMGKSCLRLKAIDAVDLGIIAEAVRRAPTKAYLDMYLTSVGPEAWKTKGTRRTKGAATKDPVERPSTAKAPAKKK